MNDIALQSESTTFGADLTALQALGLYTGVSDAYIALMTSEGTSTTPPTYDTPFLACESTEIGLTPTYAEGQQAASNRTIRKRKMLTGMTTKISYPRMVAEKRAKILGHVMANGNEILGDKAQPKCAVGVCETRDDGTMVMRWILQGEFSEGEVTATTEEDDTLSYTIPTLEHAGVRVAYRMGIGNGAFMRPVEIICDTALEANQAVTPEKFFAAVPDLAKLAEGLTTGD